MCRGLESHFYRQPLYMAIPHSFIFPKIWKQCGVGEGGFTLWRMFHRKYPANIRLDADVFRLRLPKRSWRRLDQDEYVRFSLTSSEDVFKTSWSRQIYLSWPCLLNVFNTSFKTSSRSFVKRLQDVFKTSRKDIFKTFSRRIIKLNYSCSHVFEKHSTRFWDIFFQRRLSTEGYARVTPLLINLWSVYKICKRDKIFSSFSFSIYYTF